MSKNKRRYAGPPVRSYSVQDRVASIQRNGITLADLKDNFERGVKAGYQNGLEWGYDSAWGSVMLALHREFGFGRERLEIYGPDAVSIFCELTAYRYDYRAGDKESNPREQDLGKARWYRNYDAEKLPAGSGSGVRKRWQEVRNAKLSPCPKCGGPAHHGGIRAKVSESEALHNRIIACRVPECRYKIYSEWLPGDFSDYHDKPVIDELVRRWEAER